MFVVVSIKSQAIILLPRYRHTFVFGILQHMAKIQPRQECRLMTFKSAPKQDRKLTQQRKVDDCLP